MGTIKSVKSSMGYTPARERTDTCIGCAHVEETIPERMPPFDTPILTCSKGGFHTSKMAVCRQHEPKKERRH